MEMEALHITRQTPRRQEARRGFPSNDLNASRPCAEAGEGRLAPADGTPIVDLPGWRWRDLGGSRYTTHILHNEGSGAVPASAGSSGPKLADDEPGDLSTQGDGPGAAGGGPLGDSFWARLAPAATPRKPRVSFHIDQLVTPALGSTIRKYAAECGLHPRDEGFPAFARVLLHVARGRRDVDGHGTLFGMDVAISARKKRGDRRVGTYRDGDAQEERLLEWLRERVECGAAATGEGSILWSAPQRATPWQPGRVTCVRWEFPKSVQAALDRDGAKRPSESSLIYVDTGASITRSKARVIEQREADARAALRAEEVADLCKDIGGVPEVTLRLIAYLHGQDLGFFARGVDGYLRTPPAAFPAVSRDAALEDAETRWAASAHPRPTYAPSVRTQRVVPNGPGLPTATKKGRRSALPESIELDGESMHFSLMASVWDVPEAREWRAEMEAAGASVWAGLTADLGEGFPVANIDLEAVAPEPDPEAHDFAAREGLGDFAVLKRAVKAFVMGLLFAQARSNLLRLGNPDRMTARERMDWTNLCDWLCNRFGLEDVAPIAEALLRHPALGAMYRRREEVAREIEARGYLTDVFGRTYTIGEQLDGKPVTVRTCLAADAQACEHFVMCAIAVVVMDHEEKSKRSEVAIRLWQYYGFSLWVRKKDRAQMWVNRLRDAFAVGLDDLARLKGCPPIQCSLKVDFDGGLDVV